MLTSRRQLYCDREKGTNRSDHKPRCLVPCFAIAPLGFATWRKTQVHLLLRPRVAKQHNSYTWVRSNHTTGHEFSMGSPWANAWIIQQEALLPHLLSFRRGIRLSDVWLRSQHRRDLREARCHRPPRFVSTHLLSKTDIKWRRRATFSETWPYRLSFNVINWFFSS